MNEDHEANPETASLPTTPTALRVLTIALDLAVFAAAGGILPDSPAATLEFGLVAFGAWLYAHDDVMRWRTPALLAFGVAFATAVVVLLARGADALGLPWTTAAASRPLPVAVGLSAGHAVAALLDRTAPKTPVRLEGTGRLRRLAVRAVHAPFSGLTPTPYADRVVPVPRGHAADRGIMLRTPRGPRPLHPEGSERGMGRRVKRSMDLAFGLILVPVFLPTIIVFAVLVRLTSSGRAFYSQRRLSLDERPFTIHKLRSMGEDAEPDGVPVWPRDRDERITPLGRLLRRAWIDELPQLWNVFSGSMSLVGPRPERPEFVAEFRTRLPNYPMRHQVKAGMTGLAQVAGLIGNTSLERRLVLDLRYVRRWSPLLDLVICLRTGAKMLGRLCRRGRAPR